MKITIGALVLGTLAGAISGYYLGEYMKPPQTVKTITKVETHTRTVTVKSPDGTTKTETTTDTNTDSKTQVKIKANKTVNVSGLVANDFSNSIPKILYGVIVTKQLIGPTTIGGFALTNGVVGVSLGWGF